jgi:hypothetical protein
VLVAVREAVSERLGASSPLEGFSPDSLRVAFENMGGRSIRRGQSLCGWSRDGDLSSQSDGTPKVQLLLGTAQISMGFKYSRGDRDSLDVVLRPGEALVRFGEVMMKVRGSGSNADQPWQGA